MAFSNKVQTVLSMGPWTTAQVPCPQSQPSRGLLHNHVQKGLSLSHDTMSPQESSYF